MHIKQEFQDSAERYKWLMLLWCTATLLLLVANVTAGFSFAIGFGLFILGALNLGVCGVYCAYSIARHDV